jgi:hypothetical protein
MPTPKRSCLIVRPSITPSTVSFRARFSPGKAARSKF